PAHNRGDFSEEKTQPETITNTEMGFIDDFLADCKVGVFFYLQTTAVENSVEKTGDAPSFRSRTQPTDLFKIASDECSCNCSLQLSSFFIDKLGKAARTV